jgi:hypothetical protein
MKTFIFLLCCCMTASAQTQSLDANAGASMVVTNPISETIIGHQIGEQAANQNVWQKIVQITDAKGNVTYQTNNAYTELATGLNHLVNGQWVASKEEIDISADGNSALATNGQHQAYFPGDIYSGQIELVTPDGKQLFSRPVGLSYFDGTNSVLIAELTNSTGEVVNNNQVIYANAFTDFGADIRYTYTKAGFEQDIILSEQPPAPASFGLNPDTTKLQVLTEFFDPPQPRVTANTVPTAAGNLEDDQLSFGTMAMGWGKAFMMGNTTPSAEVEKQWVTLDGRQILVEEVPVISIAAELENLPLPQTTSTQPKPPLNVVSTKRLLPAQRLATVAGKHPMQLAQVTSPSSGLVLDYNTVNTSLTNYTFQGDTTYYISGAVNLYGTDTFEGGTVIKYANTNSAGIQVNGPINCLTGPYRPAIFTAKDDNSVGEAISGSTGNPTGTYAGEALTMSGYSANLGYMRFAYANSALVALNSGVGIKDSQFVNDGNAITALWGSVNAENVLIYNVSSYAFGGYNGSYTAQNVTVHDANYLSSDFLYATNSLFIACTNLVSGFTGANNYTNSSDVGIFQTVGAGAHYLATNCPTGIRAAGTTNIDPALLADLQTKTTYPPVVYSNAVITTNMALGPQALHDTNALPDVGYHYDPLDYVFGGCDLYTNLDFSAGTAVAWFENYGLKDVDGQPYGLSINDGAKVSFHGTAAQPNWFLRFNLVQEGNGNWLTSGWMPGLMLNGSGSAPLLPEINATFTKWSGAVGFGEFFRDAWNYGVVHASNSEFYIAGYASYAASMYFTNCLFDRDLALIAGDTDSASLTYLNCTFHDGAMLIKRYSGKSPSFWLFENCAFDGTLLITYDQLNANTNSTEMDYNCYNPSNSSWMTYPYSWYGAPSTNVLEVVGPHDITVTNYNWESSWFGNYYQPTNSPLINKGSTNANLLGLYHFTTQTNQAVESDSIVDIGYHYVATDTNGIPLDSNGDGIPDYLEDANGNGLVDSGEIGWNIVGDLNLQVLITRPRNGATVP